ncbi:hypothetical protein JTE90_004860 [Oedothorax gibbosus]|uniref:Uncharacterized protein n=1 Tax=Oedothorax gibbosus TaxID=931172 RepID=A0AAV6USN5_9ARAC|nr:hypothetical protein JTE90_004860 [Oedothorax gibbosus]
MITTDLNNVQSQEARVLMHVLGGGLKCHLPGGALFLRGDCKVPESQELGVSRVDCRASLVIRGIVESHGV